MAEYISKTINGKDYTFVKLDNGVIRVLLSVSDADFTTAENIDKSWPKTKPGEIDPRVAISFNQPETNNKYVILGDWKPGETNFTPRNSNVSAFTQEERSRVKAYYGSAIQNLEGNKNDIVPPELLSSSTSEPAAPQAPPSTTRAPSNPDLTTESSSTPVRLPDQGYPSTDAFKSITDPKVLNNIKDANIKVLNELNEKGEASWTEDERKLFQAATTNALAAAGRLAELDKEECKTRQTDKGWVYTDPKKCEEYLNSVAYAEARATYSKEIPLPDPCGTGTLAEINTALLSFFKTLKKIKKYGQLYVNGTINKVGQISNLIRNVGSIIAAILKILIQRLRNYLIGKIRAGINDLIDLLLPTIGKALKNTIVQKIVDTIFCKFKDIMTGLVKLVGDFLFELIGKIVNVPFCAAQQFTNALINNLASEIDKAVGPILDQINDVLGPIGNVAGTVFQAIDFILGFESFLCAKPECPKVKSFIGDPAKDGPNQQDIDNFNNFLPIPSDSQIIEGATGWTKDLPIFGGTLGQFDGTIPDSITQCDTAPFRCGPPSVEIFGGGGAGAVGNAVVDEIGRIVGVDLVFGGSNYSRPPFVTILDPCENGNFASAYAEINDDGEVTNVVIVNSGSGYSNVPTGLNEFDQPVGGPTQNVVRDYIICLSGFKILSTGIGYTPGDTVKITPNVEGLEAVVKMTEEGQIIDIQMTNKVCGLTQIPEINIESNTGSGVQIKPVFEVTNVNESTVISADQAQAQINATVINADQAQAQINATPNISIDANNQNILDPVTRRSTDKKANKDDLKARTKTGKVNVIRVIDCVR
ncbi:MAG: hypothetical protein ACO25L_03775 [Candidatus Nanopelagicales bacterium]